MEIPTTAARNPGGHRCFLTATRPGPRGWGGAGRRPLAPPQGVVTPSTCTDIDSG